MAGLPPGAAGLPPSMGGGAMPPIPPGGPPGAAPGVPPGMPPPGMAMPPPRPQTPGPASPLAFAFTDLPSELSPGWQLVDLANRLLKTALRTADFQRTPKTAAVISSTVDTLGELVSHYTSAGDSGGVPSGAPTAPDDDALSGEIDAPSAESDEAPEG